MQVCTSLQTDNHANTSLLSFLQAGCPSCRPTNSVKALKAKGGQGSGRELPPLYLTSSYEPGRIQNRLQFAKERAVDDRCRHSERMQMCRQIVPDSWCVVLLGWTPGGAMCYVLVRERVPLRVGG